MSVGDFTTQCFCGLFNALQDAYLILKILGLMCVCVCVIVLKSDVIFCINMAAV